MKFQDLLARLPGIDGPVTPIEPDARAFQARPSEVAGYVRPRFVVNEWPDGANVVLVEAPGAVGKSAAARALSASLNWPLILAEHAQVGSYSLSGLIHDSLGVESDYIAKVAMGNAGVVIDSLDEALFRAGTENFWAFIDNVQKVAGTATLSTGTRMPSVLLFSRSEAAEDIKLSFLDADVPLASLHLDFFDENEAKSFIEAYLLQRFEDTRRPEYNVFRGNPAPFRKLRDSRLKQVAAMLTRDDGVDVSRRWSEFDDFLGYAPVLTTIAESLAVTNPAASKNTHFNARSQNDLIGQIALSILKREKGKFLLNMEKKLTALSPATSAAVDREGLYTIEEQCARLVSRVDGIPIMQTSPVHLPLEVRPVYEAAAGQFILDHPFLRHGRVFSSTVFSDYVRARAATDVRIKAELESPPPVRADMVGPFYARFLMEQSALSGVLEVPEIEVEAVIASWEQEQELADKSIARTHKFITFEGDFGSVVCTTGLSDAQDPDEDTFQFTITNPSGAYQLGSRLRRIIFYTDQGVILGSRGQHLELGHEVAIFASEVVIESESLRVTASAEGCTFIRGNMVLANFLVRVDAEVSALRIGSSNLPPLLRPYLRTPLLELDGHSFIEFSDYVDLRNVLMAFRPSLMGARVHCEYFENRVIRDSQFRRSLSEDLERRQIIRRDGNWVYLETRLLTTLGFGLMDIKRGEPSSGIVSYISVVNS